MNLRIIWLLLLILLLVMVIPSCRQQTQDDGQEEKIPVKTVLVKEEPISIPIRASGKLFSKTESKLSFKTGGIIERILVDEGQAVKKDQLLARLKLSEIRSQVQQAELALQKAQRDYNRVRNLYNDSVATLEQYQDAGTALEVARSNVRIARFNLEYSEIRAPSNGSILKKIAEENEIVGPGYPVLFFASTEADWVVRVNLTDKDIVRVKLGDSAGVSFDAYPYNSFQCIVSEIGNAADPYTGTYEVELLLVKEPEKLASGFIGKVDIYPSDSTPYALIPVEALIEGKGLTGVVYVLEENKPVKRNIKIHAITDTGLVIKEGLMRGEEIITDGGAFVRENVEVQKVK